MSDAPPASLHLTIPGDRRKRKRDRSADYRPSPETEEKRRRIRQAGAMLFVERGVSGFGMATLARQTRVSPGLSRALWYERWPEVVRVLDGIASRRADRAAGASALFNTELASGRGRTPMAENLA